MSATRRRLEQRRERQTRSVSRRAQSLEPRAQGRIGVEPRVERRPLGLVELAVEIGGQPAVVVVARRHSHASFVSCVRVSVARAAARRLITVPIGAPRSSAASR